MNHRIVFLMLALAAISFSQILPNGLASEELVVNGGFESGEFNGWDSDATCQIIPMYRLKPHGGWYSARIGAESRIGTLSQTVTIPDKSRANFSFAYKLDEGAVLDVYLSEVNGSTIQHWSLGEETDWRLLKYSIDPRYAGRQILLTFKGKVFTEERLVPTDLVTPSGEEIIVYMPVKINYWIYIDSVSVVYRISFYDVNLGISGLPGSLSAKLLVDGSAEGPVKAGASRALRFTIGESHEFKVEDYVYENQDARYVCRNRTANTNASTDQTLTFNYTPQYLLTVESRYGKTEGSGWFDAGSTAKISVAPVTVLMDGYWGSLGAKYVFKGWRLDSQEASYSGEVKMDSPKKIVAIWEGDYSQPHILAGGLITAMAVLLALIIIMKIRKHS